MRDIEDLLDAIDEDRMLYNHRVPACRKELEDLRLRTEWQPIHSAPKDKEIFLLCDDGDVYVGHYHFSSFFIPNEGWIATGRFFIQPVKWMLIPNV